MDDRIYVWAGNVDTPMHVKLYARLDFASYLAGLQVHFDKIGWPDLVARHPGRGDPHHVTTSNALVARNRSGKTRRIKALDAVDELLFTTKPM